MSFHNPRYYYHCNSPTNHPTPRPIPTRSSLLSTTLTFTDLGAGPGPSVQDELSADSTPCPDPYLARKPTVTPDPDPAVALPPKLPLFSFPALHPEVQDTFADPPVPETQSPPASTHPPNAATSHTRTVSSVSSATSIYTSRSSALSAPLNSAVKHTAKHTVKHQHQRRRSRSSFRRHARKFSAKTAVRVQRCVHARQRGDTPVEGGEVPPVPKVEREKYFGLGGGVGVDGVDDVENEEERHWEMEKKRGWGKGHRRWQHSSGGTLAPSPREVSPVPAVPLKDMEVEHRPDRFAEPERWEKEAWDDTLARLEGKVTRPHPLLVAEVLDHVVPCWGMFVNEGQKYERVVGWKGAEGEDLFEDAAKITEPFSNAAATVAREDGDGDAGVMRSSAWLSGGYSPYVDPYEMFKKAPAQTAEKHSHKHKRSSSDSIGAAFSRLTYCSCTSSSLLTVVAHAQTLTEHERVPRLSTLDRELLIGTGRASQQRRRQTLLPDDHAQENISETSGQADDERIKSWVSLQDPMQERRSALRVLDEARRRRSGDAAAQQAPSMVAIARGLLADDVDDGDDWYVDMQLYEEDE